MPVSKVNGLPRVSDNRVITEQDIQNAKYNNQFFLVGTDPEIPVGYQALNSKNIYFLEFVQASGTFTIVDANGTVLTGTLASPFGEGISPLRLDGGFRLVGAILGAKGYYLQKD